MVVAAAPAAAAVEVAAAVAPDPPPSAAGRHGADAPSTVRANRHWWDGDADAYQAEHGDFLGDADFVWCPENLREEDAHLLGDVTGREV
ncbi:MAG: hypothetical protein QOH89_2843, partial [Pseudonocardiales bacterium]|nr:hypothetical protein [Pseudonocardiales bacterium]